MKELENILTQLAFEKANYKLLADKVGEYIKVQSEWKKYKRADLFYKKCALEKELTELINPNKVKQSVLDWQAK